MPSQTALMPRPKAARARGTRPGPDGRLLVDEPERDDALRLGEEDRRAWLPDVPDREREVFDELADDFLLRDRGGEDVRGAMVARLGADHSSPRRHTPTRPHQSPARPKGQASRTVGMIIGLRRSLPETKPPSVRRMTCCSP